MTKPTKGEPASEAMARHKAAMAQREKALKLMASQAARSSAAAKKAKLDPGSSRRKRLGPRSSRCE